jgi:hypothetical protein
MTPQLSPWLTLPLDRQCSSSGAPGSQARYCRSARGIGLVGIVLAGLILVRIPSIALAGGGPENLVLVVNADSGASKLIANYYIAGRNIPASHVIYLNGIPDKELIPFEIFLENILKPIFQQIEERKIGPSIDYIVYSADFPTVIDVTDLQKMYVEQLKQQNSSMPDERMFLPNASINAMTYFASLAITGQPYFFRPDANTYFRAPATVILSQPFVGPQQQQYQQAVKAIDDGSEDELKQAVTTLEEMAQKNPLQIAVSYNLARLYSKLKNPKLATKWLTQAMQTGWCFRKYTQEDSAFTETMKDPLFKGIVDRMPNEPFDFVPPQGFKSLHSWGVNGIINHEPGQGNRYFLSTVLAATRNQGNSEQEALQQLLRTMKVDGTNPKGTFYFTKTNDVRTKTREGQFGLAIKALQALGHPSKVIETDMPMQARDVMGLSSGIHQFEWTGTGSKILPGAICENLTSYGGIMLAVDQTKLTEFIKFGAAGSSGTVTEPLAVPFKFPHPLIHAHYASGCTLAEAYYQSVAGPFQLLIVGDPLCQPWAKLPQFKAAGLAAGDQIKGSVKVEFDWNQKQVRLAGFEIYLDGVMVHRGPIRSRTNFDTKGISDGYHELRFVAVAESKIQTTGRAVIPFEVNNLGHSVKLSANREKFLETDKIVFKVTSNCGDSIELKHNGRSIAKKIGREVEIEVPAKLLGIGPVSVNAISIDEESKRIVSSVPTRLSISGPIAERPRKTRE